MPKEPKTPIETMLDSVDWTAIPREAGSMTGRFRCTWTMRRKPRVTRTILETTTMRDLRRMVEVDQLTSSGSRASFVRPPELGTFVVRENNRLEKV